MLHPQHLPLVKLGWGSTVQEKATGFSTKNKWIYHLLLSFECIDYSNKFMEQMVLKL